jgi:hypothetical protein
MTRINVINPVLLSDKHLGAEYRELPRIFNLVRKAQLKGYTASTCKIPPRYTMGKGHVRFFYNKLGWLLARQKALIAERLRRGMVVNYPNVQELAEGLDRRWFGHWTVTKEDIRINLARINERGGLKPFSKHS